MILCHVVRVLKRREGIPDMTKPEWWKQVQAGVERVISWYCVAMQLPHPEELLALPPLSSQDYKELTKEAQLIPEQDWLKGYQAQVEANMRHVVTLGRRCIGNSKVSGWKKEDGSYSNKLANCLMKEVTLGQRLEESLMARKGGL